MGSGEYLATTHGKAEESRAKPQSQGGRISRQAAKPRRKNLAPSRFQPERGRKPCVCRNCRASANLVLGEL